jgi:hypothetical protein
VRPLDPRRVLVIWDGVILDVTPEHPTFAALVEAVEGQVPAGLLAFDAALVADDEDTETIPARVVQAEAKRARRRARNLRRVGVRHGE